MIVSYIDRLSPAMIEALREAAERESGWMNCTNRVMRALQRRALVDLDIAYGAIQGVYINEAGRKMLIRCL